MDIINFENNKELFKLFKSKSLITYDIDAKDIDRLITYTLASLKEICKNKFLENKIELVTNGNEALRVCDINPYRIKYVDHNNKFIIGYELGYDSYSENNKILFTEKEEEKEENIVQVIPENYEIYSGIRSFCISDNYTKEIQEEPILKEILKGATQSITEYLKNHSDSYYAIYNIAHFGCFDK